VERDWSKVVSVTEQWMKIEGNVYVRRSFDEGKTWEAEMTSLTEIPFLKRKLESLHTPD
jgi:hypothetical protein